MTLIIMDIMEIIHYPGLRPNGHLHIFPHTYTGLSVEQRDKHVG